MTNPSKKTVIFWMLACCLLVSCTARAVTPPAPTQEPVIQAVQAPSPTPANTYFVDVWVDNPTPSQDDEVILIGMLNRNGVFLSGITMQAFWPDESNSRGMPNCNVQLSYARGVCVIDAGKYAAGQYVPIRIVFELDGKQFTGETGFTRK